MSNELTVQNTNLPDTIDDLSKFILVGREKLTAIRAAIRAINKLQLAEDVHKQKQEEAAMLAEALLDAEVRLGELIKKLPKKQGNRTDLQPPDTDVGRLKTKTEIVENLGFSEKQAERFETLAENQDIVEFVKAAKEELGVEELTAIADRGFYSGEEFKKCREDRIAVIVPKPDRGETQSKGYTKSNFRYDKENDVYICPLGQTLALPAKRRGKSNDKRYYCKGCVDCPSKELCTPKSKYRYIARLEFDDYADEVDAFTRENYELYGKRKCLVEHPFGTVKRALGFTYFLTRGTENVRTESLLHFLAYNMKHLINILNTPKIEEAAMAKSVVFLTVQLRFLKNYLFSAHFAKAS